MYFKRPSRVRTKSAWREDIRAGFNYIFYFSQSQNHSLRLSEDNCLGFKSLRTFAVVPVWASHRKHTFHIEPAWPRLLVKVRGNNWLEVISHVSAVLLGESFRMQKSEVIYGPSSPPVHEAEYKRGCETCRSREDLLLQACTATKCILPHTFSSKRNGAWEDRVPPI